MKVIVKLCKLLGISVFVNKEHASFVKKHSIKRVSKRMHETHLLRICSDIVKKEGTRAIHFEYMNKQKEDGVYALKYSGYIWVFSKEDELITFYVVSKSVDFMIERPLTKKIIENCVIGGAKKVRKLDSWSIKENKYIKQDANTN